MCAIFSSIVRQPRNLSKKVNRIPLSSFSLQTKDGLHWYSVKAEVQITDDPSNSGMVISFQTDESGVVIAKEDVGEALVKIKVNGVLPDEMLNSAAADFNSKKFAEIFLVMDGMQMQMTQVKTPADQVMFLSKSEISQGASQKIELSLSEGRSIQVSISLSNDEGTQEKVRQLDYVYVVEPNAKALSQEVQKKDVLLHIAVADKSFILPKGVAFKLAELINEGVAFSFTHSKAEKSKNEDQDKGGVDNGDKETLSLTKIIGNGMSLKVTLTDRFADSKRGYGWSISCVATGKRKSGTEATAQEIVKMCQVFGSDINVKESSVSTSLSDINNGSQEMILFNIATCQSTPVSLNLLQKGIGKMIGNLIEKQSQGLLLGKEQEKKVVQETMTTHPIQPIVLAFKLSNGQTMEVIIESTKDPEGNGSKQKVVIKVTGNGKNSKVTGQEIVNLLKADVPNEIGVEEFGLFASAIDGVSEISSTFYIGEGSNVFYYPQIKNLKEQKVFLGGEWHTLQDLEILRQQNKNLFVDDGQGGYIFVKHMEGGQQVDFNQMGGKLENFNINDWDIDWQSFKEQKEALFKAGQQPPQIKREIYLDGRLANEADFQGYLGKMSHGGFQNQFFLNGQFNQNEFTEFKLPTQKFPDFSYKFVGGLLFVNQLKGMTREEFDLKLASLMADSKADPLEVGLWRSIPVEGFENSKVYHFVDNQKMDDEKFNAWRLEKENLKRLIIEKDQIGSETYYFNGQKFDKFMFFTYMNQHPEFGYQFINGQWYVIQPTNTKKTQTEVGIKDGKVWVNKVAMTYDEYYSWWTGKAGSEKWDQATIAFYKQFTLEDVLKSEWSVNIGGKRYNKEQFDIWRVQNMNTLMKIGGSSGTKYYFGGNEYTEQEWEIFAKKNPNQFVFQNGQWLTYQVKKVSGPGLIITGPSGEQKRVVEKSTTKMITFEGKQYTQEDFNKVIEEYKKKGYKYANGQFTLDIQISFSTKEGEVFCNGKVCDWAGFVEWRNNYLSYLQGDANNPNPQYIPLRDMTQERFTQLGRIYNIGSKSMNKAEFQAWLKLHPGFSLPQANENGYYSVTLYPIEGEEMTLQEARDFILKNPHMGYYEKSYGEFAQYRNLQVDFKSGAIFIAGKEQSWEYYEKFRSYWLIHSDSSEYRAKLTRLDKDALKKSTLIYFIDNKAVDEAGYQAWLKLEDHKIWVKYPGEDGRFHFQKPAPFAVFVNSKNIRVEYQTEEEFKRFLEQSKLEVVKISGNVYMEKPKVEIVRLDNNMNFGGQFQFFEYGFSEEAAVPVPKPNLSLAGAFSYQGFSSIQNESLKYLIYAGVFKAGIVLTGKDVIKSENFGMSNHKITIKINGANCEFVIVKSEGGKFDYDYEGQDAKCKSSLALTDTLSKPSCGNKAQPASVPAAVMAMIERGKNLGVLSKSYDFKVDQIRGCGLSLFQMGGIITKVTYQYTIPYQVGNSMCQIKIYEKNGAFAYIENFAELTGECKKMVAGGTLI